MIVGRSLFQNDTSIGLLMAAIGIGLALAMSSSAKDSATGKSKQIVGASAVLTEVNSGLSFPARIDTGAETCSLHVEKVEIQDKSSRRRDNIGKTVRILLKDKDGKSHWIESIVADAVRVKSSSLPTGDFDHRYKVRLTLELKGIRKEVLVTLNNRTDMEYPLLVGRNFLRDDFLVDVSQDGAGDQSHSERSEAK
jgi:hypothetical protein